MGIKGGNEYLIYFLFYFHALDNLNDNINEIKSDSNENEIPLISEISIHPN